MNASDIEKNKEECEDKFYQLLAYKEKFGHLKIPSKGIQISS